MAAFAEILKLEQAGPNLWKGDADPSFAHAGGRFGGWTAAMLLKSVMSEPGKRGAPLSLTVLFTDAVNDGPIEVSIRLLRSGSRLQFWRAELHQRDKICAHAQITFGVRRSTIAFTDPAAPPARPPEDPALKAGSPPVAFGERFVGVWETVSPLALQHAIPEGEAARSQFWARNVDGHQLDHSLLTCLADYAPPRVMYRRRGIFMSSTVSMNVYFHATQDEIASVGNDFVLTEVEARRCEGGYFDHELKLWSRGGALLATSEQIAAFRD